MTEAGYIPPPPPLRRMREAGRNRGAWPVARDCLRWAVGVIAGLPWTSAGAHGEFTFQDRQYRYLFDRYKHTWMTERAVEVPVVQAIVDAHAGKRILELGNVLSHYRAQHHLVVDKYERGRGVVNRDVLELDDLAPFDLIVAISTLEHVGWDELPREPGKSVDAVRALVQLLGPSGRLVFTVPAGYNPALDAALQDGTIALSHSAAMRRIGHSRRWHQVAPEAVWSAPYDFLLYAARGVLFACVDAAPG